MNKQVSVEQVKRLTGASWSALRDQYAATAQTLCEVATKARSTRRKFRGYTAEHAQSAADEMAARAAECAARA
jgi:hypothetical protein